MTLLLVYPLQVMGSIYLALALLLGGIFIYKAWLLMQAPTDLQIARSLFKYSLLHLMLLFTVMVIDTVVNNLELIH